MSDLLSRITIEPGKRSGRACIRGLRICVYDVLEMLAGGATADEILHDFPDLEADDIRACFAYAAKLAARPVATADSSLAEDWLKPEEDAAWIHLQPKK